MRLNYLLQNREDIFIHKETLWKLSLKKFVLYIYITILKYYKKKFKYVFKLFKTSLAISQVQRVQFIEEIANSLLKRSAPFNTLKFCNK